MRKFMRGLLAAVGIGSVSADSEPTQPTHEASMNFDLENVEIFLSRIERKLKLGLDPQKMAAFTAETVLDDERSMDLIVHFDGKEARLEYRVFMDDIAAPDIYFFSNFKPLTDAITDEFEDFADELGI